MLGIRAKSYFNRIYVEITKLFLKYVLSFPASEEEEFILQFYIEKTQ